MMPGIVSQAGRAGQGTFVVTTTVLGSVAVIVSTFEKTMPYSPAGLSGLRPTYASRLFFNTVASSAEPSWNVTPSRSPIVQVVFVASGVIDLTRNGFGSVFSSRTVIVS
jgi:hypothetical protein